VQRLYAALHGTLGSYLRDALQKGNADVVVLVFSSFLLFAWWPPLLFLERVISFYRNKGEGVRRRKNNSL
jgi:hypothetical protein